ncbi:patatin-like phospholipase family protein [Pseudomonas fluorescens]|uniref:patatin-like phospholipase family protein n=1 Tax=Pseudomonas fluorescens TaxID=294 RepID=UPI003CC81D7D
MASKNAIVFAGGGSLGAVQMGMLQALVEANVQFDFVVGASVGPSTVSTLLQGPILQVSKRWQASGAG